MSSSIADTLAWIGVGLLTACGLSLVRLRWASRGSASPLNTAAGWLAVVLGFVLGWATAGPEVGTAAAALILALVAFGIIAVTREASAAPRRIEKEAASLEPDVRPSWSLWRGLLKSIVSIGLCGVAAIGLGVAFAVAMPLSAADRIILGGLLVPILWGAGMAWTLADPKVARALLVLLLASGLGYGIAFLPKFMSGTFS